MNDESYAQLRPCADGGAARTVEVRSDLFVDVDQTGRVLGVERIGDEVRPRDLEDVVRVLVYRDDVGGHAGAGADSVAEAAFVAQFVDPAVGRVAWAAVTNDYRQAWRVLTGPVFEAGRRAGRQEVEEAL